jgi:phenylacetate-CoA ligase
VIRRLAWHRLEARKNPGWRGRLATIRTLASGTALEAWRASTLADHLAWARAVIPFFRDRVPPGAPLESFPVLTRQDLQRHADALRDPTRPVGALRADASGGSTGEPVRLWHDEAYWTWTFATEAWLAEWWGLRPWSRTAYLWGDDREVAEIGWKQRLHDRLLGRLALNAFSMDDRTMAAFAARLERFQPECLQGYATALDLFGAFLARERRWKVRPLVIRSAAEALFPERRKRIEEAFGRRVQDVYGSRESASLAAECLHGGFHALVHGKVIELVDDAGRPVAPGVPGRVLVTDLTNRAFGLVRYENGDVASWSKDEAPCPCDCRYPRLERVLGRTSDFLTTPAGLRIHGEWFTHLFYGRDDVRQFQVRQTALDAVEVLTVGPALEEDVAPLLGTMRARLGPGVRVTWRGVDAIPPTRSGKHRFTVSEVPYLTEKP